jgi:hypothetical protein
MLWRNTGGIARPAVRAQGGQSLLSVDLDFGVTLRAYRTFITWAIVFLAMSGTGASAAGKPTGIKTNGRLFFGRPRMLERKPIGLGVLLPILLG